MAVTDNSKKENREKMESMLNRIRSNSIPTEEPKKIVPKKSGRVIRKAVQADVDRYLELHAQMSSIRRELDGLRGEIEPYMDKFNIPYIEGETQTGRIEIVPTSRPEVTSRYTLYNPSELGEVLNPDLLNQCLVSVVDSKRVENLINLKKIPKEIEELKELTPSTNFSVKR